MLEKGKEIVEWSGRELSKNIQSKEVSCQEVMDAYLNQIDKVNPKVTAIVALQDRELLMKQAKEKDEELQAGNSNGWMHGFPQAIKDLENTAGIVSSQGSPIFKDYIPKEDSLLVKRMKDAGSIIIGKTNTPEWGFGSQTYNPVYGPSGNPYDPERTTGGSSGGAASALALRMQAVADGSDFMGSLRNPAGYCNVYGYRPSWGRIPSPGADLFLSTCPMRGPMARTVADLALLLGTQSGYDAATPATLEDDVNLKNLTPDNVEESLKGDMTGKKVAWLGDWNGYLPMEDGVLEVCENALKTFPSFGASVEAIENPFDPELLWNEVWLPFRHFGAISLKSFYDDPEKKKLLKPEAIFEYEGSLKYNIQDLYFASVKRSQWFHALLKVFETYDFVAVPTAQVFAFDKNIHWPTEVAGKKMDTYHRWMEIVTHWTLTGNPVAAIPAGFNKDGLSMGIQLIGKPRSDFELLKFAYAYEQANDVVGMNRPGLLD
jgi:amidase